MPAMVIPPIRILSFFWVRNEKLFYQRWILKQNMKNLLINMTKELTKKEDMKKEKKGEKEEKETKN